MKDPEFIMLRNRFVTAILITLLFVIPLVIFVVSKYGVKESEVLDKINKKDDFVILFRKNSCDYCNRIEEILNSKNIYFIEVNTSVNERYNDILKAIDIKESSINEPSLFNIEDGKVVNSIVNIDNDESILEFINYMEYGSLNLDEGGR